jgi:hypothetical protein
MAHSQIALHTHRCDNYILLLQCLFQVVSEYHYGDTVILDDWFKSNDGFIWGRYTGSSSGLKHYVAVGRDTGKVENDDYLIKLY